MNQDFLNKLEAQIKLWRELQKLDEESTEQYKAGMAGGIKFMLDELRLFLAEYDAGQRRDGGRLQ